MRRAEIGVLCSALLLPACGGDSATGPDGTICTAELRPGILITVLDQAGASASCGAQAVITEGLHSETVQNPAGPSCVNTLLLSGAVERPGVYNVTVSKPGYANAMFTNVAVTADVCHVVTVNLTAQLKP